VAQNKDQWRALVNTIMNLQVVKIAEKFLSSYTLGGFQVGLSSLKLVRPRWQFYPALCFFTTVNQYKDIK
jgi:hypothetical protein